MKRLDEQGCSEVDEFVARKIRQYRQREGLTLKQFASLLEDVSFQQLQKYEKAANRISSGRLHQIARSLSVPISHFFPRTRSARWSALPVSEDKELQGIAFEALKIEEFHDFLLLCNQIEDPEKRRRILRLCLQIVRNVIGFGEEE